MSKDFRGASGQEQSCELSRITEETKPVTQQKQTTREQNTENSLSQNRKTHKMLNVSKRTETKPKPKPTLNCKNC